MINYIGVLAVGLIVGIGIGVAFCQYLILRAEKHRQNDIATGTPIASQLAREMKIKLDDYEEKELWV